jgi:hypothetical protein
MEGEGMNHQEWIDAVHKEAKAFRKQKAKEIFGKSKPIKEELELLTRWAEMFKGDLYDRD